MRTERQKQWCKDNYEHILKQNREWNSRNKEARAKHAKEMHDIRKVKDSYKIHLMWLDARRRSKNRGWYFDLEESNIVLPEKCPILGIPLTRLDQRYSPSLDRKDSTKGYTKDNVWVISTLANKMKWDSTKEERLMFAKGILALEGGDLL